MTEMSKDEWNKVIDEWIAGEEKLGGTVSKPPLEMHTLGEFPVGHRLVTEDLIRQYADTIGDPNPLWHDPSYARNTRWGGIIAPPTLNRAIAEVMFGVGDMPVIPNFYVFWGGSKHEYFKVIRPGDEFRVTDKYIGITEKTKPGQPYRLFVRYNQRSYINQRDEIACIGTGTELITAIIPGEKDTTGERMYASTKRHHFTKEELDLIHRAYDEELEGKLRRGAEVLYWEDIVEGEELKTLVKGPTDMTDMASCWAIWGLNIGFAVKWRAMRNELEWCPIDPETGEYHHGIDWHYLDSLAQSRGAPFAVGFGALTEGHIAHLVCNWMGDDGFVKTLDLRHRRPYYVGDMSRVKGKIAKKYIESGEHLVDLEVWSETQDGNRTTEGTATVRLISRKD